jgi:hypothetical protein
MKEGDYLVGIGDADVKWSSHVEVYMNAFKNPNRKWQKRIFKFLIWAK